MNNTYKNPPKIDDFGNRITSEFISGRTAFGPWAIMTPRIWKHVGLGRIGTKIAQRYVRQHDGAYVKMKG